MGFTLEERAPSDVSAIVWDFQHVLVVTDMYGKGQEE